MVIFTSHSSSPQPNPSAQSPPQSPLRTGRLRGLSYLRNYTNNLHLRSESSEGNSQSRRASPLPSPGVTGLTPTSPLLDHLVESLSLDGDYHQSAPSPVSTTLLAPPPSAATSPGHAPTSPIYTLLQGQPNHPIGGSHVSGDIHPPSVNMAAPQTTTPSNPPTSLEAQMPSIRFLPHHDPRANRPSLGFQAISRTLPSGESIIKVGRYSERDQYNADLHRNSTSAAPVGFKSKVVSRKHCEFWCENNQWYIRDVKSSSGTFLNHLRLSPPGVESKPWAVNDGDVVQLGIDFKGGEEPIYRCVKIRVECNRSWQKGLNPFNKQTHRRIRKMAARTAKRDSDTASLNSTDCTICLMSISPCQSLFVAPCSHVWHYKCIRPILNGQGYPNLLCPNCRASIDLEADVEEADSDWEDDLQDAIEASRKDSKAEKSASPHAKMEPVAEAASAVAPTTTPPPPTPPNVASAAQATATITPPGVDTDGDYDMVDATNVTDGADGVSSRPPPTRSAPPAPIMVNDPAAASGSLTPTPPRAIPGRPPGTAAAIAGPVGEGPITPRNDAGPFVLDGGAGRSSGAT